MQYRGRRSLEGFPVLFGEGRGNAPTIRFNAAWKFGSVLFRLQCRDPHEASVDTLETPPIPTTDAVAILYTSSSCGPLQSVAAVCVSLAHSIPPEQPSVPDAMRVFRVLIYQHSDKAGGGSARCLLRCISRLSVENHRCVWPQMTTCTAMSRDEIRACHKRHCLPSYLLDAAAHAC